MKRQFVVALTGASGAVYAVRLIEALTSAGCDVHLTISPAGAMLLKQELGINVDLERFDPSALLLGGAVRSDPKLQQIRNLAGVASDASSVLSVSGADPGEIYYYRADDVSARIASGSFLTHGMVVCPCSIASLGAIASGASRNLIHRAADVHLKERRRLILVPRETPLSLIHLDAMRRCAEAGALILPAMPAFYHGVTTLQDLVDFMVGRICDHLDVEHDMIRRWGDSEGRGSRG